MQIEGMISVLTIIVFYLYYIQWYMYLC